MGEAPLYDARPPTPGHEKTRPGEEAGLDTLLRAFGKQFPLFSPRALVAVARQAAGLREGLAVLADLAGIAVVGVHVFPQGAGVRESLAAGRAGVWAVAGMGAHVASQAAGLREGHAAGRAGVWADAGMGANVGRQVARRREGLGADGARQVELATRPTPPPLARRSRAPTRSFSRRLFLPPLACDHRQITRQVWRPLLSPFGQNDTSNESGQSA